MFNLYIFISLVLVAGCSSSSYAHKNNVCQFPTEPVVILEKDDNLLQYWEYDDRALEHKTNFQNLKFLKTYKKKVRAKVKDLSQKTLRSRSYHEEKAGDQQNMRVVEPLVNSVRKINCQEALLLNLQGSRVDLIVTPTEFIAFELIKGTKTRLVYFTSNIKLK